MWAGASAKNFFSPGLPKKNFSRPKLFRRGQKLFLSRLADKNFLWPKTFSSRAKTFSSRAKTFSLPTRRQKFSLTQNFFVAAKNFFSLD
jgi:hypothetical protein